MRFTVPQTVWRANVERWVYIEASNEPTVLEIKTPTESERVLTEHIDCLFDSCFLEKSIYQIEPDLKFFSYQVIVDDPAEPEKASWNSWINDSA